MIIEPCPKCADSGILGEIRGAGETERVTCDCEAGKYQDRLQARLDSVVARNSPQDAPATLGPPVTLPDPSAMEHAPGIAANSGDLDPDAEYGLTVQRIAPDYTCFLLTIRDHFGIESKWVIPGEKPIGPAKLDAILLAHEEARRN